MQRDQQQLGTLIGDRDRLLASTRGDLFKRLYDAAQAVIAKGIWTEDERCPLCESELGSSITAQISGQLAQYREAENKATEISNAWQASAWRKCLTDYEEAKPLGFETQKRQLAGLDSMIAAGKITRDDLTAAIRWTSDLITQASSALSAAQERKTALERELPPSLVQLTEQVEYGRQFQQALNRLATSIQSMCRQSSAIGLAITKLAAEAVFPPPCCRLSFHQSMRSLSASDMMTRQAGLPLAPVVQVVVQPLTPKRHGSQPQLLLL